jgi:NAD(P)H-hydrate epimerase
VSIDIASGLFTEDNDDNTGVIFQPDYTLTFEMEKLAFQFPENQKYVGALKVMSIQLSSEFISNEQTSYFITSKREVEMMHKKASYFAYKNTFGHALLVTGSIGKMGASVLCSRACLMSGAGLVTAQIPKKGNDILQI